jgi:radical SAM protein with 4Fe4S-binding SPASM domain
MYCSVPFNRLHVDVNGNATLCYGQTWTSRNVGNVLKTDPMTIWNSKEAHEFRKSILDQSFRYCTDCRCPEMVELREPPRDIDLSVIDCLALAYDYTCNLSCPSCRTTNKKASPLAPAIHEKLMESGVLGHVKTISVMGSEEPLASPLFWDLIDRLRILECHPDPSLTLITNGVLLTPKRLDRILSAGRKINTVEISVDAATEETYLINRRGGNWNTLMANIEHLTSFGIPLRLNFVVQANNFREMPQFVDLARKFRADYVRFDAVNNWGAYAQHEYLQRAVHFPTHPLHRELKDVLRNPILMDECVHMAQLSEDFFSTLSPLETIHNLNAKHQKLGKVK